MTELSGGVVSLLNKRRRACVGVECQIEGDAVAYRNQHLKWNTNCLAEAYKLSYIVGSLPLAKNAKHSPSNLDGTSDQYLCPFMKTLSLTIILYASLMSAVMANLRDMCGILVYKVKMLGRIEVERTC